MVTPSLRTMDWQHSITFFHEMIQIIVNNYVFSLLICFSPTYLKYSKPKKMRDEIRWIVTFSFIQI